MVKRIYENDIMVLFDDNTIWIYLYNWKMVILEKKEVIELYEVLKNNLSKEM